MVKGSFIPLRLIFLNHLVFNSFHPIICHIPIPFLGVTTRLSPVVLCDLTSLHPLFKDPELLSFAAHLEFFHFELCPLNIGVPSYAYSEDRVVYDYFRNVSFIPEPIHHLERILIRGEASRNDVVTVA